MNYSKIYTAIIERARNRFFEGYKEKHHIIPRCMKGGDESSNLIDLTAKEHFICHLLLSKMHPHDHRLLSAVWLMSNNQRYGSRQYEYLRIRFSISHSNYMKGKSFATEESKRKGIETKRLKGSIYPSTETKKKISESTKGRTTVTTEESRRKNSINSKGRKWVNNGIDSCMAKGEILDDLLSKGWVLGRLLTPSLIEGVKKGGKATGGYNKGISMSDEQKEKCKVTFFKKGHVPHNKKQNKVDCIE